MLQFLNETNILICSHTKLIRERQLGKGKSQRPRQALLGDKGVLESSANSR